MMENRLKAGHDFGGARRSLRVCLGFMDWVLRAAWLALRQA
ncbi:hypothetical protein A2U01_0098542, partial [Trifolium medium]|nr:hypothetical protein [Trifolium medium]